VLTEVNACFYQIIYKRRRHAKLLNSDTGKTFVSDQPGRIVISP
jgi:hypothetical protein